jgi:hypothetical protein
MQATRPLFHKGFIGRSLDEFKRLSHIGMPGYPLTPILRSPKPS